jgi:quercetin dioxygenase-like cupin family protein
MFNYLMDVKDVGEFLGGLAAIITVLFAVFTWLFTRISKINTANLLESNNQVYQKIITKQMLREIEDLDPDKFYTMDFKFPSGEFLHVPMIPNKPLTVLENIKMTVLAHDEEATILTMTCKGFGHIPEHCHEFTCEEVKVIRGTITCIKTGKTYGRGDVWYIPPQEFHGAHLHNCVAIVTHKPPLKTAAERPVNMESISAVFKDQN